MGSRALDDSKAVELTGKIMVVAIIVFFVVVVFVIFLHLYAKWFWWRVEDDDETVPSRWQRRRRRFVFAPGQDPAVAAAALRRGLEPSVLRSLPVLVYRAGDFKDGLECAVCLSELADGEKARLLPKCNHGFHVDCIDMWFQSHSTCPLCRNSVAPGNSPPPQLEPDNLNSSPEDSMEFPNFPTNVLFWGDQTQVSSGNACLEEGGGSSQHSTAAVPPSSSSSSPPSSSSSSSNGVLAIDIPNENPATSSPSSSMLSPSGDELKSPVTTRLRSLKRLLSRERRVNPCSPNSGGDIEQASRGQS